MSELADWVRALAERLEVDPVVEIDDLLAVARVAAHEVDRPAAPLTTYVLGYAAGRRSADQAEVRALAETASDLARSWSERRTDAGGQL